MRVQDKIDEIYVLCSHGSGSASFKSICRVFWPVLDNNLSIIDLSGVFTVSAQETLPGLSINLFTEFFRGAARIKYPAIADSCEKLVSDIQRAKNVTVWIDNPIFLKSVDRDVMRTLLSFDFPLRRAFSNFAGEAVKVGGSLAWEEIQRLRVGMEIDGFIAFASSCNIIPNSLSVQQCTLMAQNVLSQYPLIAGDSALQTSLLYPQFQLLLCFVAHERNDAMNKVQASAPQKSTFAKKVVSSDSKPMSEMLNDLLKSMGISKTREPMDQDARPESSGYKSRNQTLSDTVKEAPNAFAGTVSLPSFEGLDNPANAGGKHSSARQAMLMRIDHLFEKDIDARLKKTNLQSPHLAEMLEVTFTLNDEDSRKRSMLNKPIVIGDAIPVPGPEQCHESVEQMLQAALAHHNLGNYEESLKFLEASRVQVFEIEKYNMQVNRKKQLEMQRELELEQEGTEVDVGKDRSAATAPITLESIVIDDNDVVLPLDLEMYIMLCKGNVYQSCGDDEQALHNYLAGWSRAVAAKNKEWEVVCINSIGLVAYYNVRFDIALTCFAKVAYFREQTYGGESPDTATAWNNEGSCLYCMSKRGEARIKFEKAWHQLCKVLGHRHPRSVAVWKNLDKARRSQATVGNKQDLVESVKMRTDAGYLIPGDFKVNAVLSEEAMAAGKKKKASKGKGKKK